MSQANHPYFLLIYTYSDDYLTRRALFRKQHLELVEELVARQTILLGGALENPSDRAYICFQCPDREVVDDFVRRDPYVIHQLVQHFEIRDWKVVVGTACGEPIKSSDL